MADCVRRCNFWSNLTLFQLSPGFAVMQHSHKNKTRLNTAVPPTESVTHTNVGHSARHRSSLTLKAKRLRFFCSSAMFGSSGELNRSIKSLVTIAHAPKSELWTQNRKNQYFSRDVFFMTNLNLMSKRLKNVYLKNSWFPKFLCFWSSKNVVFLCFWGSSLHRKQNKITFRGRRKLVCVCVCGGGDDRRSKMLSRSQTSDFSSTNAACASSLFWGSVHSTLDCAFDGVARWRSDPSFHSMRRWNNWSLWELVLGFLLRTLSETCYWTERQKLLREILSRVGSWTNFVLADFDNPGYVREWFLSAYGRTKWNRCMLFCCFDFQIIRCADY
jgi:hypothetical protein